MDTSFRVRLRGGFSDREGLININKTIQYDDLDERSRNALYNRFSDLYNARYKDFEAQQDQNKFNIDFLRNVFGMPVNADSSISVEKFLDMIQTIFRSNPYYDVLSIIEYACPKFSDQKKIITEMQQLFNEAFEKEYVGYRFVGPYITKITDKTEIASVDDSLQSPYQAVNTHMDKALALLSDRENPDYENSIKESITAVESICHIIAGNERDKLGTTLSILEQNHYIHPSMKEGFKKLYGYASDAPGIRHDGQQGGAPATFEDAKYMLVTCSAFINYLVGVTAKSTK